MKHNYSIVWAAFLLASITWTGCKMAPMQVIPQPRDVKYGLSELPRIPPPDPAAAEVPSGYRAEVVVSGLTYPSSIEFDGAGNLFIAEAGYSYGDHAAPARILKITPEREVSVEAEQLNGPITDLLWHDGRLYVSHRGKVSVVKEGGLVEDIVTQLPSLGDHHNNQLAAGPDGKIYLGQGTASNSGVVGVDNFIMGWLRQYPEFHDHSPYDLELAGKNFASLNPLKLSDEDENVLTTTGAFQPFSKSDAKRATGTLKANGTILRFNPDGSGTEIYAWGLRNPFGLMWSPDGRLYASDNGYDERGSRPVANAPDVIWLIREGGWYGFPDYAGGVPLTDRRFDPEGAAAPGFLLKNHPPVEKAFLTLPPHGGVTKIEFSRSESFGRVGDLFVGEVGDMQPITGNDKRPAGHRVLQINPATKQVEVFFQARKETLGPEHLEYVVTPGPKNPVDVRFSPDGTALYVADFGALMVYPTASPMPQPFPGSGTIWRISKEGANNKFPSGIKLELSASEKGSR